MPRDRTGNRRFIPVPVDAELAEVHILDNEAESRAYIDQLWAISPRAAYNLCNTTKDFRVLRIGTSIRVNKQIFDNWFAAV